MASTTPGMSRFGMMEVNSDPGPSTMRSASRMA